ncbi:metallophosphoesterase [soil metagenome]
MRVLAIADPHLSGATPKPMTVFGPSWEGHPDAFFEGWRSVVREDDLVLIPGDISWAMRIEDALVDLEAIAALPGRKVLLRGNHDYWWPSLRKLRTLLPSGMAAIQNDAVRVGDVVVAGTRGWVVPGSHGFEEHDARIYAREVQRLRLSLHAAATLGGDYLAVMLHFPPTNPRGEGSEFLDVLCAAVPDAVVFGHVHGSVPVMVPKIGDALVSFVAADHLGFVPAVLRPG